MAGELWTEPAKDEGGRGLKAAMCPMETDREALKAFMVPAPMYPISPRVNGVDGVETVVGILFNDLAELDMNSRVLADDDSRGVFLQL